MKRGWFVAACIAVSIALARIAAYCLKDETGAAPAAVAQNADAALGDSASKEAGEGAGAGPALNGSLHGA